jgi:hypothetical protein
MKVGSSQIALNGDYRAKEAASSPSMRPSGLGFDPKTFFHFEAVGEFRLAVLQTPFRACTNQKATFNGESG